MKGFGIMNAIRAIALVSALAFGLSIPVNASEAATVSVSARATGGFGQNRANPITSTTLNGLAFTPGITVAGPGVIRVTATGTWAVANWLSIGPAGTYMTWDRVQYPMQESVGVYGGNTMVGALIGAFVPSSITSQTGFVAVDATKGFASFGIKPSDLIYIGTGTLIQVSGPGTLYLGINEADFSASDDTGSLTVTLTGP